MTTLSKAASKAALKNQRGPRGSVQAGKAKAGKDKVPAGRKAVVTKGLGTTLVKHLHEAHNTVREDLLLIGKQNVETMKQAVAEIETAREQERQAAKANLDSALAKRKAASINSGYSRILGIIRAYINGFNVDKVNAAPSLALMYAAASKGGSTHSDGKKQLVGSGFDAWDKKLDRVCTKADDADALARLEKHFIHCLNVLAKFEQVTAVPVKAILALSKKGRTSHLRRAA